MKLHLNLFGAVIGFMLAGPVASWAVDCNRNLIEDSQDIAAGTSRDCNINGLPDECELWAQQARIILDARVSDLDVFGGTIVIGDDRDGTLALYAGAVYVYERQGGGWIFRTLLTASDGGFDHRFGFSVAIDGDTIVVGDPLDNATFC